jgi:hypothetical protein
MKKQCAKCKQSKSLGNFCKNKNTKDGLQRWCKGCVKEYSKKYYQVHKVKRAECGKKYYQTHKIEAAKYGKEYYHAHKVEYAKYKKTYNQTEKGKFNNHRRSLKNKYGITLEQYDEMFEQQNGVCAICGGININGRRLGVDHDHETGKIRALLCNSCNHIIGDAKENIIVLQSAINYLKSHKT